MSEREVVIVEAVRTPIGRRNGGLSTIHSADLLATALRGLIERSGIDAAEVDQVVGGCVGQVGMQSFNVTRTAWLTAGLPSSVAGHHGRHAVRLVAAGHQHGLQPHRGRGDRCGRGLRHREPEPGADGVGHRQGHRRRPGHPQELLPPVRVHHPVRGGRAHRRQVGHHPGRRRRLRTALPAAGRPGAGPRTASPPSWCRSRPPISTTSASRRAPPTASSATRACARPPSRGWPTSSRGPRRRRPHRRQLLADLRRRRRRAA